MRNLLEGAIRLVALYGMVAAIGVSQPDARRPSPTDQSAIQDVVGRLAIAVNSRNVEGVKAVTRWKDPFCCKTMAPKRGLETFGSAG